MGGVATFWVLQKSHDDAFAATTTGFTWLACVVLLGRIVPPYADDPPPANGETSQVSATFRRTFDWFSANRVIAICAVGTFIVYLVRGH
jgi:hypothetical protein